MNIICIEKMHVYKYVPVINKINMETENKIRVYNLVVFIMPK